MFKCLNCSGNDNSLKKQYCACGAFSLKNGKCQECIDREEEKKRVLRTKANNLLDNCDKLKTELQSKQSEFDNINTKYESLRTEIDIEEKDLIEEFEIERNDPLTKVIIMLGNTGDGKSTLCNRLKGDTSKVGNKHIFKTSHGSESCTKKHSKSTETIQNTKVTVVDTPGFYDTTGKDIDRRHGNLLCKYLKGCGGINAFVLVRNSTNIRFDSAFQEMLQTYHSMFGNEFLERLIVIATRVDYNNDIFYEMGHAKSMKESILKLFNIKHNTLNIHVLPIGIDNYQKSISELIKIITNFEKFECQNIYSPINDLYAKEKLFKIEISAKQTEINRIELEIKAIERELDSDKELKFCCYETEINKFLKKEIGKMYSEATQKELESIGFGNQSSYEWIDKFVNELESEKSIINNEINSVATEDNNNNQRCTEDRAGFDVNNTRMCAARAIPSERADPRDA